RTPYTCSPYGADNMPSRIGPSSFMEEEKYIFVCSDVRGRYMSGGLYDNMRPNVPGDLPIDESSDTYDTIEYLLENVSHHNGRAGQWGISYPGFYTTAALPDAHPALVASSPQAPMSDVFFDDFHHHGAYTMSYFIATTVFGYQKDSLTTQHWWMPHIIQAGHRDDYDFHRELVPLSKASRYYGPDNFFWQQIVEHPNYDAFWQSRNILPHLRGVKPAVMVVGGWFDAEDLYGPLHIYRSIEDHNPGGSNVLVMGPWSHGDWARTSIPQVIGDIHFGDSLSYNYQRDVEAPFFRHHLKREGNAPSFEARVFDTGRGAWREYGVWPPPAVERTRWYLHDGEGLSDSPPASGEGFSEYTSDPLEPVPYREESAIGFTPRAYMTDDQRFAERRPDVIEFTTGVLDKDLTLAGPISARLKVTTTGTDADWVVKLIDVYPDTTQNVPHTPDGVMLSGYQQMVRSEIFRGRFRNSYEHPEPFEPGVVTDVTVPLQDVFHTFEKGHRIMVQIQSTWFPLFDVNPQKYVDNIFKAKESDFVKATHRVYHSPGQSSYLEVGVLSD
ncbi:MAG: CocE/NonD family hydrolase, partial [Rhodothermales bacterium]